MNKYAIYNRSAAGDSIYEDMPYEGLPFHYVVARLVFGIGGSHHELVQILESLFQNGLVFDSASCKEKLASLLRVKRSLKVIHGCFGCDRIDGATRSNNGISQRELGLEGILPDGESAKGATQQANGEKQRDSVHVKPDVEVTGGQGIEAPQARTRLGVRIKPSIARTARIRRRRASKQRRHYITTTGVTRASLYN